MNRKSFLAPLALAAICVAGPGVATAAEGSTLSLARQLQLAVSHLEGSAVELTAASESTLSNDTLQALAGFSALAENFRWELEYSPSYTEVHRAWAVMTDGFLQAREALPVDASPALRKDLLRVHGLMNRIDRRLGGSGLWFGAKGWAG
jgi:hypothetical protein